MTTIKILKQKINSIKLWLFNHTYTRFIFNYDVKKMDILKLIFILSLLNLIPLALAIIFNFSQLLIISICVYISIIFFVYIQFEKILFNYKFYKYYQSTIFTRSRKEDGVILKNPIIKIRFNSEKVIVKIQSLGYFTIKDYNKIASSLGDILKMEQACNFYKDNNNYLIIEFQHFDEPLILGEEKKSDKIKLSKNIEWDINHDPHALIIGVSGSGKSYLTNYILSELERLNYDYFISDIKNEINVAYRKNGNFTNEVNKTLQYLRLLNEELDKRTKDNTIHKTPIFFVFEEFLAFQLLLSDKNKKELESYLTRILVLGRSNNIHLLLISQSPNSQYFGNSSFRDNLGLAIHLGKISNEHANMIFNCGINDLPFNNNNDIGYGYIAHNGVVKNYLTPRINANNSNKRDTQGSSEMGAFLAGSHKKSGAIDIEVA